MGRGHLNGGGEASIRSANDRARGTNSLTAESVLYGDSTSSRLKKISRKREERTADGVIEFYNEKGELYKAVIPEGTSYRVDTADSVTFINEPATIYMDNGMLHRDDGAAVEYDDGTDILWDRGEEGMRLRFNRPPR